MSGEFPKPKRTEKPWGYELLFAHTDKYAGKLLFVKKGHRLSLQYHRHKDETIWVYEGNVRFHFGEQAESIVCNASDGGRCVRIPPRTHHRIEALEDCVLFEVSTPELDDVERLADDYGRGGPTDQAGGMTDK